VPKISLFYYDTLDGGRTFSRSLRLSLHAGRMYAKVMVQKINLTLSSSTPKFFLPACFSASPPSQPACQPACHPASLPPRLPACRRACMHGQCMRACVRARACVCACVRACVQTVHVHGCVRVGVCVGRWVGVHERVNFGVLLERVRFIFCTITFAYMRPACKLSRRDLEKVRPPSKVS
jgi:hypothetical protein